jgi:hypothetical protein
MDGTLAAQSLEDLMRRAVFPERPVDYEDVFNPALGCRHENLLALDAADQGMLLAA